MPRRPPWPLREDPVIAAVRAEGVSVPERRLGATVVPAVEVPAVDIPATTAEGGCIVSYDTPAGCVPKVEISAGWIPAARLPGYRLDDARGDVREVSEAVAEAEVAPAEVVEGVCRVVEDGAARAMVRGALVRPAVVRAARVRPPSARAGFSEAGQSVPPVSVPPLQIGPESLPPASVGPESLPYERLTEGVDATGEGDRVAYQASESVLFAYNQSTLLPTASHALDAVIAAADEAGLDGGVRVEGHTDDTGTEAGNQTLSQARAQAVAGYLVGHGVEQSRITARGLGESSSAFPNDTDENRGPGTVAW